MEQEWRVKETTVTNNNEKASNLPYDWLPESGPDSSFGRLCQRNAHKCVPHLQHDCHSRNDNRASGAARTYGYFFDVVCQTTE